MRAVKPVAETRARCFDFRHTDIRLASERARIVTVLLHKEPLAAAAVVEALVLVLLLVVPVLTDDLRGVLKVPAPFALRWCNYFFYIYGGGCGGGGEEVLTNNVNAAAAALARDSRVNQKYLKRWPRFQ